jgi:hypothetical protein
MEVYERYVQWLRENQCVFPSLNYPATSATGAVEIQAARNIEPLKAFLFVHNSVIISPEKAR